MNKTHENIVNSVNEAIIWSANRYFDKNFHGVRIAEVALSGLEKTISDYQDYFQGLQELDTDNLPSEKTILSLFNNNVSILTEGHFITGQNGVVKTNDQYFTASQLIKILKNKKAFIVTKK